MAETTFKMNQNSNETKRSEFIQAELNRDFFECPEEMDIAYSNVYSWLKQQSDGVEKFIQNGKFVLDYYKPGSENEDSNWKGTGWEFSRLLPSHTTKAYKLFLQIQSELESKSNDSTKTLLDLPTLSIIDNGCGGGSVTIALLSLLINYQKHRLAQKQAIYPVKFFCLGIDPNYIALEVYTKFLSEYKDLSQKYLIECNVQVLFGTFAGQIGEIIGWINKQDRLHNVVLGMGNVIRPITQEYNYLHEILRTLRVKLNFPINIDKESYSKEINGIKVLLDGSPIDTFIVATIGSNSTNRDKTQKVWKAEVELLQKNLKDNLSHHKLGFEKHIRESLKFLGPKDYFYRKFEKRETPYQVDFESAFSVFYNTKFVLDEEWRKILDTENLLLAWARVRNELSFFQIEDLIEVRLFDRNIHNRINKLRYDIMSYRWKSLNVSEMLNFYTPKGENKVPRPLNLCRLEDQIIGVAILQQLSPNLFEQHPRSYAYRLSKRKNSEFLYEDWYEAHSRFINDARKIAEQKANHLIIRTDIASYYTKIQQNKLLEELKKYSQINDSRVSNALDFLIQRKFEWEENLGIPQGHTFSGFFSEIYLSVLDKKFGNKYSYDIEYFRYVDDIIIICRPEQKDWVIEELKKSLDELGLESSKDKTRSMESKDYLLQTEKDITLDIIGKEHITLLREMYKLDDKHYSLSQQNWWEFLKKYQAILAQLGVFISIPRLSRKIKMNDTWRSRLFNFWKLTKLPYVSEMSDLDNSEKWLDSFRNSNQVWIERHKALQDYLQKMFLEGIELLKSPHDEAKTAKAQLKIKFSSYRLGQLGFGECAEQIAQIVIEKPWLINVRRILQSLGLQNREDLLLKIYSDTLGNTPEGEYVKSSAIKAIEELPHLSEKIAELLSSIISEDSSVLEKTMASEVLLIKQNLTPPNLDNLESHLNTSSNPYLMKNLMLLLKKHKPENFTNNISLENADILNEALQYVSIEHQIDELQEYEPDILNKYYFGDYPDNSKEFRDPAT